MDKNEVFPNSILEEARAITTSDRNKDYGNPKESFENVAKIASILCNKDIEAKDCINIMIAVKLLRESHKHKRDNLVDVAGYAELLNYLYEKS